MFHTRCHEKQPLAICGWVDFISGRFFLHKDHENQEKIKLESKQQHLHNFVRVVPDDSLLGWFGTTCKM